MKPQVLGGEHHAAIDSAAPRPVGEGPPRAVAVVHARDRSAADVVEILGALGYAACETSGSADDTIHLCVAVQPVVVFVDRSRPVDAALALMGRIGREGGCPAIALLREH